MSLSNTDELLIETLNNMYNQNIRVIENLNYRNNEIRHSLIQLLTRPRTYMNPSHAHSNHGNRNHSNRNHSNRNHEDNRTNRSGYRERRTNREQYDRDVRRSIVNAINRNNSRQHTTQIIPPVANRPRMNSRTYAETSSINRNIDTYASHIIREFFTPVNVYPTQEQINTASRNVRYGDIVRPTNTTCPITLETFNDNSEVTIIRHCGHIFNTTDFNLWFRMNCRCPMCRYDIREYTTGQDATVVREEVVPAPLRERDNMIETGLDRVFSQNPTRFHYSIYRLFDISNNTM